MTYQKGEEKLIPKIFNKEIEKVTIGRSKECTLHVDRSTSFSRIQFRVVYDYSDKKWYIYDGDENKKSTNGTWLFLENYFEIKEYVNFRISSSLFNLELSNY